MSQQDARNRDVLLGGDGRQQRVSRCAPDSPKHRGILRDLLTVTRLSWGLMRARGRAGTGLPA